MRLPILLIKLTGEAKVDEVDQVWVLVTHQYIIQLQIIMYKSKLMHNLDTFYLYNSKEIKVRILIKMSENRIGEKWWRRS